MELVFPSYLPLAYFLYKFSRVAPSYKFILDFIVIEETTPITEFYGSNFMRVLIFARTQLAKFANYNCNIHVYFLPVG